MKRKTSADAVYGTLPCPMQGGKPVMVAACKYCEAIPHECKTEIARRKDAEERQAIRAKSRR